MFIASLIMFDRCEVLKVKRKSSLSVLVQFRAPSNSSLHSILFFFFFGDLTYENLVVEQFVYSYLMFYLLL